jgi:hypothetical protein
LPSRVAATSRGFRIPNLLVGAMRYSSHSAAHALAAIYAVGAAFWFSRLVSCCFPRQLAVAVMSAADRDDLLIKYRDLFDFFTR